MFLLYIRTEIVKLVLHCMRVRVNLFIIKISMVNAKPFLVTLIFLWIFFENTIFQNFDFFWPLFTAISKPSNFNLNLWFEALWIWTINHCYKHYTHLPQKVWGGGVEEWEREISSPSSRRTSCKLDSLSLKE